MENRLSNRNVKRKRRMMRVRKTLRGTALKPRLCVFRSNKHVYAQLIDDETQMTLFGLGTVGEELKGASFGRKSKEAAKEVGKRVAIAAKKLEITAVVFDRGRYKYHGVIAQLADGAREEGLKF